MKTYTNAELNQLVTEFSQEFDALVKAEVAKSGVQALAKSETMAKDDDSDGPPKKASSEGSDSAPAESAPSEPSAPPAADAASAPPADASASAAASAPAASAPAAPASPEVGSAGADPMQALVQAYTSLPPEELALHVEALGQVLAAQQQSAAGAAPAMPGAPAPAATAPAPMAAPAAGPDAVAPLAGEGSKPLDPASTMALKSEFEKELTLAKAEKADLEKSLAALTEQLEKLVAKPERKTITGKDVAVIMKTEAPAAQPAVLSMTREQITKKLLTVARDPSLKKSDRDLINNFYQGAVKVDALAHLLG